MKGITWMYEQNFTCSHSYYISSLLS